MGLDEGSSLPSTSLVMGVTPLPQPKARPSKALPPFPSPARRGPPSPVGSPNTVGTATPPRQMHCPPGGQAQCSHIQAWLSQPHPTVGSTQQVSILGTASQYGVGWETRSSPMSISDGLTRSFDVGSSKEVLPSPDLGVNFHRARGAFPVRTHPFPRTSDKESARPFQGRPHSLLAKGWPCSVSRTPQLTMLTAGIIPSNSAFSFMPLILNNTG